MRKALDGNGGRPWNSLLWDEGDLTVHAEDTLSTENLDFGDPYDKGIAPDLELSPEAQALMGVSWCEVGQHYSTDVEDGVCAKCWKRIQEEIA